MVMGTKVARDMPKWSRWGHNLCIKKKKKSQNRNYKNEYLPQWVHIQHHNFAGVFVW